MKKKLIFLNLICFIIVGCVLADSNVPKEQPKQELLAKQMNITGKIASFEKVYVIQGKKPRGIYTILNPNPDILDPIIKKAEDVNLIVRIVSGDNVEIKELADKAYP